MAEQDINEQLGTQEILWDLSDLYTSLLDPHIKDDIADCEQEASAINKNFSGKIGTLSPTDLKSLIERLSFSKSKKSTVSPSFY